jgi:type I restriction enzyme S subunit
MSESQFSPFAQYRLEELAAPGTDTFVDGPFGSSLKSYEYVDAGVRLIQLQNIGEGEWRDESKKFICTRKFKSLERHGAIPGDIAIAKMADPVARACLVPPVSEQFIVVADCIRLRLDRTRFDPGFVVRAINSPYTRRQAEKKAIGSTRVRINLGVLKTVDCLAPGLPEQQVISGILDTVDAAIHGTEAIIAKLKAVKQGLLDDLLTRGIDANGELRPPQTEAPHLYKESPLGWVPKEWDVLALGCCCVKIADRDHTTPTYLEDGVLMVSPTNLFGDEDIDFAGAKRISRKAHETNCKKTDLVSGDIILHRIGAGLGRVRLVKASMPEFSILHSMAQLRSDPRLMTNEFMLWALRTEGTKRQMGLGTQSIGVPDLGLDKISNFLVVKPPLLEQEEIAGRLNALQGRIDAETSGLNKLSTLKSGLMDDLLTGCVRVALLLAADQEGST